MMEKNKKFNTEIVEVMPGIVGLHDDLIDDSTELDEDNPDSIPDETFDDYWGDSDCEYPNKL